MDLLPQTERSRWIRLSLLGGLLAIAAAAVFAVHHPSMVSREAGIYEEIARQLISNTTEGRQAVVSSVWWPPFCTLIRLPLVFLFPRGGFPWASIAIGALSGFFLLSLLLRISRPLAGWFRAIAVCCMLVVSPFFIEAMVNGSSALLVALLVVFCADSLARWLVSRSVRALVYFAIASSFIVGLSSGLAVWLGLMLLLFVGDLIHSKSMSVRHKEAVLILGVLPVAYVASLWFLMNWLIMGDALYFLKPLWKVRLLPSVAGEGVARLQLEHFACGLIPAFTAGISAGARNRSGLLWSVFALLLFVSMLAFRQLGILWDDSHMLTVLPVFIFFTSVAAMGHVEGTSVAGWRRLLIAFPVLIVGLAYFSLTEATEPIDAEHQPQSLPVIERHIMTRSRYAKVFVCGYDSFGLLQGKGGDVFAHALDFNFNKAKNDYKGHDLFVMVKKPSGRGAGDSIHWKYADIYTLGSEETLYDTDWGQWRIFEVIQAPSRGK